MMENIKKNIYICITESLCYIPEINTTLWINRISIKINKRAGFQGDEANILVKGKSICKGQVVGGCMLCSRNKKIASEARA